MNTHYQTSLLSMSRFIGTPIYYDWGWQRSLKPQSISAFLRRNKNILYLSFIIFVIILIILILFNTDIILVIIKILI